MTAGGGGNRFDGERGADERKKDEARGRKMGENWIDRRGGIRYDGSIEADRVVLRRRTGADRHTFPCCTAYAERGLVHGGMEPLCLSDHRT